MTLEQMKYYKQLHGYSFQKLAELSGVPVGTIQKIFNGETKSPRYNTLQALEKALRPKPKFPPEIVQESSAYATSNTARTGPYTIEDYYSLPDNVRAELIDGDFFVMETPSTVHQEIISILSYELQSYIRKNNGKCKVFFSPIAVQLDCDDKTMVEPDLLILCDPDKKTSSCIKGAPDFIIEVLSPSNRRKDMLLKAHKYEHAGVLEYWLIDPESRKVMTYYWGDDFALPNIYGFDSTVPVQIYNGDFSIDFSKIAAELDEWGAD